MKTIAIVPIKSESERVKKKNFRLLNEYPLYVHFLRKLQTKFTHQNSSVFFDRKFSSLSDCHSY